MSNEVLQELVDSSAEAAYVTDPSSTVVAWNAAAVGLLEYDRRQAVGSHCWELLRGIDVHGNAYCGPRCPVVELVRRREPVHDFTLCLRSNAGEKLCVRVTTVSVPHQSAGRAVLHVLRPWCRCREPTAEQAGDADRCGAVPCRPLLSARELEVLRLLGNGAPTSQIARSLFISPLTVRTHIQRILSKLGTHSRLEAVAVARRAGLL